MRTRISLGLLAVLQLVASLAGQLAVLRFVGIGAQTDAYVAAQAAPLVLAAVVAASLQSLWLPRFARAASEPALLHLEQGIAQGQSIKILMGLALPLWISCPFWAPLLFPGFSTQQVALVVALSGPLFASAVLNGQSGLLTAGLRSIAQFLYAEVVSLVGAVLAFGLVVALVPRFGIEAAPWIALARAAMVYGVLTRKSRWPSMVLRGSPAGREVAQQIRPLVAGGLFIKSGPLVDRYWGSQAPGGSVTILTLAQLAINSLATIFERALVIQTLPVFSKLLMEGRVDEMKSHYVRCLQRVLLAVAAVGVALTLLRDASEFLLITFMHMKPSAAHEVWVMCLLLLPALYVSIAGTAAVAVFYAFGETKLPALIGLTGFLASLALKAALFVYAGILGIALGASLYLVLNMLLYHIAVIRRIRCAQAA